MEYQRGVIRSNLIDNGQRVGMDKWLLRFDAQPSVLYVKESNHQQFSIREGNPWHLSHLICHQFHLNTITVATLELNPRGGVGIHHERGRSNKHDHGQESGITPPPHPTPSASLPRQKSEQAAV